MFQKLTALLLILTLTLPTAVLGAELLYESQTTETVAGGITYTKMIRMHDTGFSQIHIVDADLNNETVSFRPLYAPRGMSYLTNVLNMAKAENAVAAMNTDFFSWNQNESGRGHAMNLQIADGELRSSSGIDSGYASLIQTEAGALVMDYFTTDITVTAPNGKNESVFLVNQYTDINYLMLYTSDWGETSLGSLNDAVELVVTDGEVSEIRTNQDPCPIPENGYILSLSKPIYNDFLTANFAIGDKVQLDIVLTPDTDKIAQAVSGGSILVADGEAAEFTHNITGKNPRSGIGFTEDGHLLLVTVDGRQNNAVGMTQEELAELFMELGAVYAMNCDGGGSSTLVTRPEGSFDVQLRNTPSGGSMRAVSAAIGLFSNAKIGELGAIQSTVSAEQIFLGDTVAVYSTGTDIYDNPCDLSDKGVTYKTDNGTLNGNLLTPEHAGTATVTVSADDVSTEVSVTVLDAPKRIEAYPAAAELALNKEQSFSFVGYGENGEIADIPASLVTLSTDSNALLVTDNRVILKSSAGGVVTATFGDCETVIPVTAADAHPSFTLPVKTPAYDPLYQEHAAGITFPVLTAAKKSDTLLDILTGYKRTAIIKQADYSQILNASDKAFDLDVSQITAGRYQKIQKDGVLVVTADFSARSLLQQWKTLFADLNATSSKNILLLFDASYSFKTNDERVLFEQNLEALAEKGKTVFVVSPDPQTSCVLKNGVRYMTVSDFTGLSLKDYAIHKERWCYPEFSIDKNQLTYRFISIL